MAVGNPQPGLFDSDSNSGSIYFLTNRNNVLRVIAAGMLMPVAGFATKYYDDLLRLAPGRIPLMASGASTELIAMVTPEPQTFPVILALKRSALADTASPALLGDGSQGKAGWANPDARMWAPGGAIPFSDVVTALHFRTQEERDEFAARDFADTRLRPDLHQVTPQLFEAEGPSADTVTEWLSSLDPFEAPSPEEFAAEDRRSGALLFGSLTAVPEEDELLGWGQLLAGKKTGKQAGDIVSRIGRVLDGATKARDAEDVALQICVEELSATNRLEVWRPLETLDRISEKLTGRLKAKAAAMKPGLDRAAAILRDEEAFEGLRTGGSPTLKALLLVLMRPEPDRLMEWEPGGPGSTAEVQNLAATMVGALTGRSMTPVDLRGMALDDALARVEADRISTSRDRAMPPLKAPSVDVDHNLETLVLKIGGSTVVERPIPALGERVVQIDTALLEDVAVQRRALEIAVKNGWLESIQSVIEATTADIRTTLPESPGGPVTIRFSGTGSIRQELVTEMFLRRASHGELSPEDAAELRGR